MKNKILAILCALAVTGSMIGCGSEATQPKESTPDNEQTETPAANEAEESGQDEGSKEEAKASSEISIGVSFGQNVHPFFVAMQKGIEKACEDYGIEKYNFLAADSSLETQTSQIENLVTMGCDVILLNPYDSEGVVNAVAEAHKSNIGVFTMDIDCEGSTAFVASNNYKVGQMLAEYVIEQLGGEGKIAIIDGITVTSLKDRTEGFMDTIKTSNIEIVAEQQTAHARDTALASAENIIQANPDIDAFVGVNENSGMAILSAVTSANLSDVLITTVDATAENMVAIRDGKVAAGVSQDPYMMGYQAVEQAIAWCNGEPVEEFIEVPVEYMTIDNIQQFIDREVGYGVEVE